MPAARPPDPYLAPYSAGAHIAGVWPRWVRERGPARSASTKCHSQRSRRWRTLHRRGDAGEGDVIGQSNVRRVAKDDWPEDCVGDAGRAAEVVVYDSARAEP